MAWGVFVEIWVRISRIIVTQVRPRWGKAAISWSKSGPSWPMLALRWRLGGLNLEVLGSILGRFGVDLGAFWHMGRIAKIVKDLRFFEVFRYSGGLEWLVEASWALF